AHTARWAAQRLGATGGEEAGMLSTLERVIILKGVRFFSGAPDEVLADVAALLDEVEVPAGADVVRQGEVGDSLYVVAEGEVSVRDGPRGLEVLGEGEAFGEMALLDPGPRSATVTAAVPSRLLRLSRGPFLDLVYERPEVAVGIMEVLVRRLRSRVSDLAALGDVSAVAEEGAAPSPSCPPPPSEPFEAAPRPDLRPGPPRAPLERYRLVVAPGLAPQPDVGAGELGAEEQDLRGVVDEQEHDHQRPGRAVGRAHPRGAEVPAQPELPHLEEHGREEGAAPHVAPAEPHVGHEAEQRREHQREDREGDGLVRRPPQPVGAGQDAGEAPGDHADRAVRHDGDEGGQAEAEEDQEPLEPHRERPL